jgi:ribosome biogenesis GTPase A
MLTSFKALFSSKDQAPFAANMTSDVFEAPPRFSLDAADPPDVRAAAQAVSDRIDEELKAEHKAKQQAEKEIVKVLLLGQSESGKSTTLKSILVSLFVGSHADGGVTQTSV